MSFLPPGAYTWDDPRFNDPNYVPPGWTGGTQPIPPSSMPGAPSPAAPGPAPLSLPAIPPALSHDQQDAFDALRGTLAQYRLDSPEMFDWVRRQIVDGVGQSSIMLALYDPSTVPGKIVDQMFPELKGRRDQGLMPISIQDALNYRTGATQMMRAAGFPTGFYDDPQDLANFQINNVSLAELKARIDDYTMASATAPAETRAQLKAIYGVDDGGLAAYYADPTKALPLLEKQFAAASLSGAGVRSGYGALNQGEAERLAALGVSADQAQQGFGALAQNRELFSTLPGGNDLAVSREQQLGAAFAGDAEAQQAIERKRRARLAVFGGGGQFEATQRGVSGLGSAATR